MSDEAMAPHGVLGEGESIVGIGSIRVLLFREDGFWYAHGLEIDYLAQGDTIEEAKESFEKGLTSTIIEHLTIHGNIERIMQVAPQEIWELVLQSDTLVCRYNPVSFNPWGDTPDLPSAQVPFQSIDYLRLGEVAA